MKDLYDKIFDYVPVCEQEENDKKIMLKYIEDFDDCLTRDNEMFHFTTSAWVVNENKDKVLMVYHNIYDSWSWIGGHADGDSDLLEACKREILEETGVSNVKLLDEGIFGLSIQTVIPHIKNDKYVSAHLHYDIQFLFEASENEELKVNLDENSNVGWIDVLDVLSKSSEEHMKPIYKKLMHKVEKNYK